jgi:hypothetical protein
VVGFDVCTAVEVGDGAGQLQHAVIAPRAEVRDISNANVIDFLTLRNPTIKAAGIVPHHSRQPAPLAGQELIKNESENVLLITMGHMSSKRDIE